MHVDDRYWDFRAPENYLFVPDWMMRTLRLRPRDVVKVRHVKLPGTTTTAPPHRQHTVVLLG